MEMLNAGLFEFLVVDDWISKNMGASSAKIKV